MVYSKAVFSPRLVGGFALHSLYSRHLRQPMNNRRTTGNCLSLDFPTRKPSQWPVAVLRTSVTDTPESRVAPPPAPRARAPLTALTDINLCSWITKPIFTYNSFDP